MMLYSRRGWPERKALFHCRYPCRKLSTTTQHAMAEGVIPVQTHLFNGQTRSFNKRRSYHEGDDIRYTKKVLKKRSEDID